MTVIAAIWDEDKREAWIGSDSMACADETKLCGVQKWTVREPWAVGHAGNLRAGNLLQGHARRLLADLDGAFDFTNRLKALFEDENFNADTDEGPKSWGQQFVLAHPGGVWSICTGLSVLPIPPNVVWADGTGRAYALGAGHVFDGEPGLRVEAAVAAAIHWCASCGGEVFLQRLKG